MDDIKSSSDGAVTYAVLGVMGLVPAAVESRLVDSFSSKATAVITNVPGPREPVFLADGCVRSVMVWAPLSGSVGMSVSIFSYRDEVSIGLLVDANRIPDPELIVYHLELAVAAWGDCITHEIDAAPRLTVFAPHPMLTVTLEREGEERDKVHFHPGGQGVWVARMVAALGAHPVLCGFLGGESGALLKPLLQLACGDAEGTRLINTMAVSGC